jgi:hypothetical protein
VKSDRVGSRRSQIAAQSIGPHRGVCEFEHGKLIAGGVEKWAKVIKFAGIRPD